MRPTGNLRRTPLELWDQARAEHPLTAEECEDGVRLSAAQSGRFRVLMYEHGYQLPGFPVAELLTSTRAMPRVRWSWVPNAAATTLVAAALILGVLNPDAPMRSKVGALFIGLLVTAVCVLIFAPLEGRHVRR